MLPISKPIVVVPGVEGARWITQGLGNTRALESEDVELEAVTPQRAFFRVGLNLDHCFILAPTLLRGILQPGRASR